MRTSCIALLTLALAFSLAAEPKKPEDPTHHVPYSLTATNHIVVRVKINGKGPFNFILDTGSPSLFVATAVGKKLGIEADEKGWATFDRFEIEGGITLQKVRGRVSNPFQIDGMNQLGLAGMELHGIIGYDVLARFRITFDFSKDKLAWTKLKYDPPAVERLPGKGEIDGLAGLVKALAGQADKLPERPTRYRGFLGVELAEKDGKVVVAAVLLGGPAAKAGLRQDDRIVQVERKAVARLIDVYRLLEKRIADDVVEMVISREGKERMVEVRLGRGL
jgi:hypothetical protein